MSGFDARALGVAAVILGASSLLGGCGAGYYWQASMGHLELMRQRRPVDEVMADPRTAEEVRAKLRTGQRAVDFAHDRLGLPDNGSYRVYADTGRPFVVWNVVAAPEFSLEPRTWCFPIAGCVSYRGYFAELRARKFADGLAEHGDDVFVGGVAAYSTLGRFADPLLNTMIGYVDYQLAGLIFHELAHQLVYVKDDSKFNEGFASFVEREGLRRWLESQDARDGLSRYRLTLARRAEAQALLVATRRELNRLYASEISGGEMRTRKAAILAELRDRYRELRANWQEPPHFDHWFEGELNNARLVSFATYDEYVPAFAVLLRDAGGELAGFYAGVEALAALETDERTARMDALLARAPSADLQ
jgi:predicted aminopeptidase